MCVIFLCFLSELLLAAKSAMASTQNERAKLEGLIRTYYQDLANAYESRNVERVGELIAETCPTRKDILSKDNVEYYWPYDINFQIKKIDVGVETNVVVVISSKHYRTDSVESIDTVAWNSEKNTLQLMRRRVPLHEKISESWKKLSATRTILLAAINRRDEKKILETFGFSPEEAARANFKREMASRNMQWIESLMQSPERMKSDSLGTTPLADVVKDTLMVYDPIAKKFMAHTLCFDFMGKAVYTRCLTAEEEAKTDSASRLKNKLERLKNTGK